MSVRTEKHRQAGSRQDPGRHRHDLSIPYVNRGTLVFFSFPQLDFRPGLQIEVFALGVKQIKKQKINDKATAIRCLYSGIIHAK